MDWHDDQHVFVSEIKPSLIPSGLSSMSVGVGNVHICHGCLSFSINHNVLCNWLWLIATKLLAHVALKLMKPSHQSDK